MDSKKEESLTLKNFYTYLKSKGYKYLNQLETFCENEEYDLESLFDEFSQENSEQDFIKELEAENTNLYYNDEYKKIKNHIDGFKQEIELKKSNEKQKDFDQKILQISENDNFYLKKEESLMPKNLYTHPKSKGGGRIFFSELGGYMNDHSSLILSMHVKCDNDPFSGKNTYFLIVGFFKESGKIFETSIFRVVFDYLDTREDFIKALATDVEKAREMLKLVLPVTTRESNGLLYKLNNEFFQINLLSCFSSKARNFLKYTTNYNHSFLLKFDGNKLIFSETQTLLRSQVKSAEKVSRTIRIFTRLKSIECGKIFHSSITYKYFFNGSWKSLLRGCYKYDSDTNWKCSKIDYQEKEKNISSFVKSDLFVTKDEIDNLCWPQLSILSNKLKKVGYEKEDDLDWYNIISK